MIGNLESLRKRLETLVPRASAFSGNAFRSTTPHYATEQDLLTGEGSRMHGGQWNPPGLAAVYASGTPETAMAETLAHVRYYGLSEHEAMPKTFVAVSFDLNGVLDLTDGKIRRRIGFSLSHITNTDWRREMRARIVPFSQLLGQAAADLGFEALVVPSVAGSGGWNIVAFPKNFGSASIVKVIASERL